MTDKDYGELLEAIAAEYMTIDRGWGEEDYRPLQDELTRLSSLAVLTKVVGARSSTVKLMEGLGHELTHPGWYAVQDALHKSGVTEAFDDYGEALLDGFRRSAVPDADLDILRNAGIHRPDAVLRLMEQRAPAFARRFRKGKFKASQLLEGAEKKLKQHGRQLQSIEEEEVKPRKFFKGISRILAGGAGAVGNVLLGLGILPTAAPVGAAAVLASCTGALVLMGDGMEALRGTD